MRACHLMPKVCHTLASWCQPYVPCITIQSFVGFLASWCQPVVHWLCGTLPCSSLRKLFGFFAPTNCSLVVPSFVLGYMRSSLASWCPITAPWLYRVLLACLRWLKQLFGQTALRNDVYRCFELFLVFMDLNQPFPTISDHFWMDISTVKHHKNL